MLIALSQSDCFGEMAYIDKTKAQPSASVISIMQITLIKIKSASLKQASENLQLRFNRAFLKVLVQRLAQTNAELVSLVG